MGLYSMRGRDRSVILKVGEKKKNCSAKKAHEWKGKKPCLRWSFQPCHRC